MASTDHEGIRGLAATKPLDGSFVTTFASVAGLLLLACAVTCFVVDPFATFGTQIVPPMTWQDRQEKSGSYLETAPRPETVILGSSRSMKIRPSCLTSLAGGPTFNFAVNSARTEDLLAVSRFVFANQPTAPRTLVIGIDAEMFHNRVPPDSRLQSAARLRPYNPVSVSRWRSLGEDLLGFDAVSASVRSLALSLSGRPAPASTFGPDGFVTTPKDDEEMRLGTFDLPARVRQSVDEYRYRYEGFDALSGDRVAYLHEVLKVSRAHGTQVVTFLTPLHPDLLSALSGTTIIQRVNDVRALLRGFDRDGFLSFHDTFDLASFGGSPEEFLDGAHMTETNSVRLVSSLFVNSAPCAVQ